jgi:iron complex transport system substrate-binding protein
MTTPRLLLLALTLAGVLTACGEDADTGGGRAAAAPAAEASAFPVTIRHKFGETTLTEAPTRVVVAGLREQDALLALGIVPVATTEWYGGHPGAIFPWAEKALGDAPRPTVLSFTDGIQFERIARLRPDLILALYSGLTQKDYDTLSKIAPVVAQPPGQVDWGSSWQDEILTVGKAVGKPREAERLRDEAEAQLAAAANAHAEFAGQTAAVATPYQGIYVYGPQDARSRLLTDLGFTFPPELENIGGEDFGGNLSDEKLELLDVGALVWSPTPAPLGRCGATRSTAGSTCTSRAARCGWPRRASSTRPRRSSACSASRCSWTSSCPGSLRRRMVIRERRLRLGREAGISAPPAVPGRGVVS